METLADNKRLDVRRAGRHDNAALLELTSQTHMEGSIALRIDRHPDFFSLLKQRGESVTLVVENEGESGIIGCVSVTRCRVYINGRETTIHYLSDLKVARRHQGKRLALQLNRRLKEYLISVDADILFMVIADGNYKMKPYIEGIGDLPEFKSAGLFKVMQFFPSVKFRRPHDCEIESITPGQQEIYMMNNFYRRYQLGKIITSKPDESSKFVALKADNEILAMISLVDMSSHKQNVVMEVSGWLNGLIYLSERTDLFKLPLPGEPVKMLYINNIYYKSGHLHKVRLLVKWAGKYALDRQAHFLSIGLHEKDPLLKVLNSGFRITFNSRGYLTSLKGNKELLNQITEGMVFEDYSLV